MNHSLSRVHDNDGTVVVFLAHLDDEIFVLPYLLRNRNSNYVFVYLVDYMGDEVSKRHAKKHQRRLRENRHVLSFLSREIPIVNIVHCKDVVSILDGFSHFATKKQILAIRDSILVGSATIKGVLSLSLEGGHQDHDLVWAICRNISNRLDVDHITFSAYRHIPLFSKNSLYTVMSPIESNEVLRFSRLKVLWLSLRVITSYRSQLSTWVGLAPFIVLRCLSGRLLYSINDDLRYPKSYLYALRMRAKPQIVMRLVKEVVSYEFDHL